MGLFKKKTVIEKLILANGRILIERTEHRNIYKILKVAKNVNYEGLGKKIQSDDLVICSEYMYNSFKLDSKEYFIITAKSISGYFE
jgi:co-chaperonin GroES (HSP10)